MRHLTSCSCGHRMARSSKRIWGAVVLKWSAVLCARDGVHRLRHQSKRCAPTAQFVRSRVQG
ncbi:UNVERIFIED_CONTAM: hypothetical protein GTU68_038656 [Idotea baltica]|nr:hypothetical protein [Idotea baltica]